MLDLSLGLVLASTWDARLVLLSQAGTALRNGQIRNKRSSPSRSLESAEDQLLYLSQKKVHGQGAY